ncbi:sulfotransferase family 2, cytosolic sulfotransferase 3 isoform X3 [Hippocampus zosterae]|uniref:sulfotransferase family 2, cytosolic sulfotransferase 3 isoform X3 n=1 Tax=Hippocampus zosterae TaxID=109293 RepID=UPI00223E827A|nr:sulfotransferase family 2, cytosolic sulfotransferase 3 isoform X3 [Hippocampus zosterae]
MSIQELYFMHHGHMLPKETHSQESLTYFAQQFTFKDDDAIAVTYPKSGTVWMQEILPLVLNGGDLTPIQTIPNWDRVPWLEEKRLKVVVDQLASPRALVTHFPYELMPQSFFSSKAKVIYVMRNPKDVAVSSYYFHQMATFLEDPGTWEEFIDKFLEGRVMFGKWTNHVKSWRHTELEDRIMYITYEQMIQDLPAALRLMSDFLGKNLSDEVIEKIASHCSFKSMQANVMSNFTLVPKIYMDSDKSQFLRKGVVGDWKNHFSSKQLAHFSTVIYKELEGESFTLPWSLDGAADVTKVDEKVEML